MLDSSVIAGAALSAKSDRLLDPVQTCDNGDQEEWMIERNVNWQPIRRSRRLVPDNRDGFVTPVAGGAEAVAAVFLPFFVLPKSGYLHSLS